MPKDPIVWGGGEEKKPGDTKRNPWDDPLSTPPGWLSWMTDYIQNAIDPAQLTGFKNAVQQSIDPNVLPSDPGPWKVYDSTTNGNRPGWVHGRGWSTDSQNIAGRAFIFNAVASSVDVRVWTNKYDASAPVVNVYNPGAGIDLDVSGWVNSKLLIWTTGGGENKCYASTPDGVTRTLIADKAAAPFSGLPGGGAQLVIPYPIQRTTQDDEFKAVFFCDDGSFTGDGYLFVGDVTGTTPVKLVGPDPVSMASMTPFIQLGNSNVSPERHISNRERSTFGLMLTSPPGNIEGGTLVVDTAGAFGLLVTDSGASTSRNYWASFSPDGNKIAWNQNDRGTAPFGFSLWWMDLRELVPRRIGAIGGFFGFCWTPNSEGLIAANNATGELDCVDLSNGYITALLFDAGATYYAPQFFGNSLICGREKLTAGNFVEEVVEVDPNLLGTSTYTSIVTKNPNGLVDPDFVLSPDGTKLMVAKYLSGDPTSHPVNDIWVYRTQGLAKGFFTPA